MSTGGRGDLAMLSDIDLNNVVSHFFTNLGYLSTVKSIGEWFNLSRLEFILDFNLDCLADYWFLPTSINFIGDGDLTFSILERYGEGFDL